MELSIGTLLKRGLIAGAAGGAASALFIRIVTETHIGHALLFEDAAGLGAPPGEAPLFDRATQHLGGMLAGLIYGVVLGVVFAVVFALLRHRVSGRSEFGRAAWLAAAAFVATSLLPGLKYPPNPPTVGNPDSIGQRTAAYLLLMVASIVLVYLVFGFWHWMGQRATPAPQFLATAGVFAALITVTYVAFPASPDAISPPYNEAVPALQVSDRAPKAVLDKWLQTARATDDEALRDPADADRPLDLSKVDSSRELAGKPVRLSTSALVPHSYTTMLWHFRLASFAGLLVLWTVMGGVFGWLLDAFVSRSTIA